MQDQIVLLEGRKEVTTFLLDDGEITSKDVVTETGQNIGYDYTDKLYPEDTVAISPNSQIGKEMVKKYTGDEVPISIIVNDPVVMENGQRKASVLVLGQLYRLKLASGVSDIKPADKIKLGENGAVKSDDGEFLALHPVNDSDEYNYVNCIKLASGGAGEKGDTGDTGPQGVKGDTGATGATGPATDENAGWKLPVNQILTTTTLPTGVSAGYRVAIVTSSVMAIKEYNGSSWDTESLDPYSIISLKHSGSIQMYLAKPTGPVYMGVEYGVFGKFRFMTQAAYDALSSYDNDTIYFVRS